MFFELKLSFSIWSTFCSCAPVLQLQSRFSSIKVLIIERSWWSFHPSPVHIFFHSRNTALERWTKLFCYLSIYIDFSLWYYMFKLPFQHWFWRYVDDCFCICFMKQNILNDSNFFIWSCWLIQTAFTCASSIYHPYISTDFDSGLYKIFDLLYTVCQQQVPD